jgi:putative transposase
MSKINETQFPVGMMCRLVSVSHSGYCNWRHGSISDRVQANQLLDKDIKHIFDDEKGRPAGKKPLRNTKLPRTVNHSCR